MVRPLFDTNVLIDYLGGLALARDELARYPEPAISVVTWMEVLIGAKPAVELATRRFPSRFTFVEYGCRTRSSRHPPRSTPCC
jgi:predicted nucleic acid-binding protein